MWYHPKYYKELRKRNKSDQAISLTLPDGCNGSVRPDPGLKQQASSAKQQAASLKLQASQTTSYKRQAPSMKLQAPSHKLQALRFLNLETFEND